MHLVHVPGVGPPLVFVHGFACSHSDWREQIGHFRSRNEAGQEVSLSDNGNALQRLDPFVYIGPTLTETTDASACAAAFPYFGDARLAAGEPLVDNAEQCQLKPPAAADYSVTFTADQWTRLQQAFPDGVCDWSKKPVGFHHSIPWLTFAGGPGGRPLGHAPESHPGPPEH